MKTFSAKPLEVKRDWYVVDGSDKVLGRLATEIAARLRGKKPARRPTTATPAIRAACMKRPSRKCRPSTRAVPSKSL